MMCAAVQLSEPRIGHLGVDCRRAVLEAGAKKPKGRLEVDGLNKRFLIYIYIVYILGDLSFQ
jgi:hypothetical protein